jgi:hypothetical protein
VIYESRVVAAQNVTIEARIDVAIAKQILTMRGRQLGKTDRVEVKIETRRKAPHFRSFANELENEDAEAVQCTLSQLVLTSTTAENKSERGVRT